MRKSLKKAQVLLALGCICVLTMAGFCGDENDKPQNLHFQEKNPVTKVDEFWVLAKKFSEHNKSIYDLTLPFSQLSPAEKKKLNEKNDGDYNLTHYLAKGQAGVESAHLLEEFLSALDAETAKNQVQKEADAKNALGMLHDSTHRHTLESDKDRQYIAQVLLHYDNNQVNDHFDALFFTDTMAKMDKTRAKNLYGKLSDTNVSAWMTWVVGNKTQAQPLFKEIYPEVGTSSQANMRNALLEDALSGTALELGLFLSSLSSWNLDKTLASDVYSDGTISGSLGHILMEKAHAAGDYAALALNAQRLAVVLGPAKLDAYFMPLVARLNTLLKDAQTGHANLYLGYKQIEGLLQAAAQPVATLSNNILQNLYHEVMKTKTAADLAAHPKLNGDKFIHLLVKRKADVQTYNILDRYLTDLAANQANEIKAINDEGKNALQLLFVNRTLEDDPDFLDLMKWRLAINDDGTALNTLEELQLRFLVDLAYKYYQRNADCREGFRRMHASLLLESEKKRLMRTRLRELHAGNAKGLRESMIKNHAKWGLDLEGDTYGNAGYSLLEMLAREAMDSGKEAAYKQQYRHARAYQKQLQAKYNDFAMKIKANLEVTLTNTRTGLANYLLALNEVEGLMEAAASPNVTNKGLQKLYSLVTKSVQNAILKLKDAGTDAKSPKFIHHVARRKADTETSGVFIDYLTKLAPADATSELQALDNDGASTFELLYGARKAETLSKLSAMQNEAMKFDDGSFLSTWPDKELQAIAQKAFANRRGHGSNDGEPTFKAIYLGPKLSDNAKALMRNELLRLAHASGKEAILSLIGTVGNDPWGLQANFMNDKYKHAKNPAAAGDHEGFLRDILVALALDDHAAGVATALDDLHHISQAQKAIVEAKNPRDWEPFAQNARAMLVKVLVTDIHAAEAKLHGYAEYILDLDCRAPNFDAKLVMAAADSEAVENSVLRWLYERALPGPKEINALDLEVGVVVADNFVHRITTYKAGSKRHADEDLVWLLKDFLLNLNDCQNKILAVGAASKTTLLQKLLDNNRTDNNEHWQQMLVALVESEVLLPDDLSAQKVLEAVFEQSDKYTMAHLMENLDLARIKPLIELCAKNVAKPLPKDSRTTLGPLFAEEFQKSRWDGIRENVRNNLLKGAYEVAFNAHSGTLADKAGAGLLAIQAFIEDGFFTKDDLAKKEFNIFGAAPNTYLPYGLYSKAAGDAGGLDKVSNVKKAIHGISTAMSDRLDPIDHQRVLKDDNIGAKSSILDLISPLAGSEQNAKKPEWCDYQ